MELADFDYRKEQEIKQIFIEFAESKHQHYEKVRIVSRCGDRCPSLTESLVSPSPPRICYNDHVRQNNFRLVRGHCGIIMGIGVPCRYQQRKAAAANKSVVTWKHRESHLGPGIKTLLKLPGYIAEEFRKIAVVKWTALSIQMPLVERSNANCFEWLLRTFK